MLLSWHWGGNDNLIEDNGRNIVNWNIEGDEESNWEYLRLDIASIFDYGIVNGKRRINVENYTSHYSRLKIE